MNFIDVKAKCVSFQGQYGTGEEQLNKVLQAQSDAPKKFRIGQIIPIVDRGNSYFWFFYRGEFPEKEVWEKGNDS